MNYPLILCGDQIEFEKEWEGRDPKSRPDWPLPSFDAQNWAEAFCKAFPEVSDIDTVRSWFANALMRGYDEATARFMKDG